MHHPIDDVHHPIDDVHHPIDDVHHPIDDVLYVYQLSSGWIVINLVFYWSLKAGKLFSDWEELEEADVSRVLHSRAVVSSDEDSDGNEITREKKGLFSTRAKKKTQRGADSVDGDNGNGFRTSVTKFTIGAKPKTRKSHQEKPRDSVSKKKQHHKSLIGSKH